MMALHPRRPLYTVALIVCITTAFLLAIGEENGWQMALVAAVGLAIVLCVPKLRGIGMLYLVLFGILLSSLGTCLYYAHAVQPLAHLDGKTAQITARITAVPTGDEKQYRVTVLESNLLPTGTRLSVAVENDYIDLERYGSVRGTVSLYTPANTALHGDGIFLAGNMEAVMKTEKGSPYWYEGVSALLQDGLLEGIYALMPSEEAAFAAGVCVGDVSGLSGEVDTDFRKSGLAHLTVVSGLHMTILSGAIRGMLKGLRARRGVSTVITLGVLWIFMLIVGFSVSVIRASVMLHCILIGETFRRRADSRTSLAVALLIIVLQNPYAICDVGFLLSFTATWGLIVLVPLWNTMVRSFPCFQKRLWLQQALQPVGCSLAAMVFTAPVLARTFGTVAVLSPIANVLTGLPVTVMLPMTLLGGLLYHLPIVGILARPCLWCAGRLARWTMWVAHEIAEISGTGLQIRHPVWLFLLLLLPFSLYWSAKLGGKRGVWRLVLVNTTLVVAFALSFSHILRRNTFVRVAAAGYSTVVVVETEGFTAAVVSGQDAYACDAARRYLLSCGVSSLELLVVTDPTTATATALKELTQEVPVKTVLCAADKMLAGATATLQEDEPFNLSDAMTVQTVDDWWRLDIGQTRVLFAAQDGALADVPTAWHRTHLAVIQQSVPDDISLLSAQQVVAVCTDEHRKAVVAQLVPSISPVRVNKEAAFCTRGDGDLTVCDRFWL